MLEVKVVKKNEMKNRLEISADNVEMTSQKNGISKQNQNQNHNAVKQAQGPNTKR